MKGAAEFEVDVPRLLEALGVHDTRRQGDEIKAICPLPDHDDHDPSFTILNAPGNEHHGHWRCYGCSRGGGPVGLVRRVMRWERVDGAAVRQWIAENAGDLVSRELPRAIEVKVRSPKLRRFRMPSGFVHESLDRWPGPVLAVALDRGLTAYQVDRWRIGYALEGRLEGRIVMPVLDSRGMPCGYQARTFIGDPTRYLTPDPSEGARPDVLFGEHHWPSFAERRSSTLELAEGGFDALSLERAGAHYIGAVSGGGAFIQRDDMRQLSAPAAAALGTWGRIVLAFDPDWAGRDMTRAVKAALERHVEIVDLLIPLGYDANSYPEAALRARRSIA